MKNFPIKGFTLIEAMIVVAIVIIFVGIASHPRTDHQCIAGFKFTNGGKQIIGQNGSGVPCDNVSLPQPR
jgi:prepilin-type N-terminal cleavage/methylation domain-containing protein